MIKIIDIFKELKNPFDYSEYHSYCALNEVPPVTISNYAYKIGSYEMGKIRYGAECPDESYRKFHEEAKVTHDIILDLSKEYDSKQCGCKKKKFGEGALIK